MCVSYDPARCEGPLLTNLTVYPKTHYRPDLPTDIRLYLCVVGDARVHVVYAFVVPVYDAPADSCRLLWYVKNKASFIFL